MKLEDVMKLFLKKGKGEGDEKQGSEQPAPAPAPAPAPSDDGGSSNDFSSPGADDWSSYIAKGGLAQRAPRKSMLKGGRVDKALTGRSRDI